MWDEDQHIAQSNAWVWEERWRCTKESTTVLLSKLKSYLLLVTEVNTTWRNSFSFPFLTNVKLRVAALNTFLQSTCTCCMRVCMYEWMCVCMCLCVYVHVSMCVCMYVCMCLCVYVCVCVCMYVFMCVCMYVCMCLCVYVCVCVCMYVFMCVCMCLCVYVCVYVCMYVFMYVCMYVQYVCYCEVSGKITSFLWPCTGKSGSRGAHKCQTNTYERTL